MRRLAFALVVDCVAPTDASVGGLTYVDFLRSEKAASALHENGLLPAADALGGA
jgi:hypothetical protein